MFMLILMAVSLVLIGYALIGLKTDNGGKNNKFLGNSSSDKWICLALLVLALVIRAWQFGVIPYGMNQDEAMGAVDAKALAEYGTDRFGMRLPVHFTAWGFGQMSVLLSYCMVPFFKLFGFNPVTIRLPMLIFSMLGMWALYRITQISFGNKTAMFALAICAVNPWHFMQSRWSLDCNLYPHIFIIGVLFLLKGIRKKYNLYISMFFFAMSMYCYGVSLYTVPFFLVVTVIVLLCKKRIKWFHMLNCIFIYMLFAWPFFLTMAINTFKWDTIETPLFTIPSFPNTVRYNDILFFSDKPLAQLWSNFKSFFLVFIDHKGLNCQFVNGYAPVFWYVLPFGILGIVLLVLNIFAKKDTVNESVCEDSDVAGIGRIVILIYLLTGVETSVLTANVNINRVNIIFYPVMILCAFGIYWVIRYTKWAGVILIPITVVSAVLFLAAYFGPYARDYKSICYTDFMDAVRYLGESDCEYYVITPDSQAEGTYYVSEIMTLYALDVDSKYFQNEYPDANGHYYYEKFRYERSEDIMPYESGNIGYVLTSDKSNQFDEKDYECVEFGGYTVAVPIH